ncbi:MAG: phage Enkosi [Actinomycetota bacterium]|jgi:transposase
MRAFEPEVVHHVWERMKDLIPRPADDHPLGCHRRRAPDWLCFKGILIRLITGCSWQSAEAVLDWQVSDTTLRARRNEWLAAGLFDTLFLDALDDYDRAGLLDLEHTSADGSLHKAPCGGPGSGPNPCDRGKLGWKWLIIVDATGVPVGWVIEGANRQDSVLLSVSLDSVSPELLERIRWLHLDRGFDNKNVRAQLAARGLSDECIARKRPPGQPDAIVPPPKFTGKRWTVERTNSWLSNYGQMRRNTDRCSEHRHAQLAFTIAILIIIKLIDHANRSPIH